MKGTRHDREPRITKRKRALYLTRAMEDNNAKCIHYILICVNVYTLEGGKTGGTDQREPRQYRHSFSKIDPNSAQLTNVSYSTSSTF